MPQTSIDSSPEGPSLGGASWAEGLSKGVFVHKKIKRKDRKDTNNSKEKKGKKRNKSPKEKINRTDDYLKECFESRSNICVR